jgi:hypothetical protein
MSSAPNIGWKWKVLCATLVVANVITLRLLFDTQAALADSEDWLVDYKFSQAMRDAGADFLAGRFRVYEIETHEYPPVGQPLHELKPTFTGRKDGPMEVWTRPRVREDDREKFWFRLASTYVSTYNARMRILYERRFGPKPIQTSTNSYPRRYGLRPVPATGSAAGPPAAEPRPEGQPHQENGDGR